MAAIRWRRQFVSAESFESAGVWDVDGDGVPDIVSGGFWYRGPDFVERHALGPVSRHGGYHEDFSTIGIDVTGNGRLDVITGGWFEEQLVYRACPDDPMQPWPLRKIADTGNIETTRAWDVDGDGELEVVPNCPGSPLIVFKPTGRDGGFSQRTLHPRPQGHGLGFGKITGRGHGDFVYPDGILEAPDEPGGEWVFSPELDLGVHPSVPILVSDVNGNGHADLIVGQAHGYGLDWYEQRPGDGPGGGRAWVRHPIDPGNSQYHDLILADVDGDGVDEVVTGKRYRAHEGADPGSGDDLGLCWFKWNGESFTKQVIAWGPVGVGKGCGIHFAIADLRGTGRLDVVAPGKDGLVVFLNGC